MVCLFAQAGKQAGTGRDIRPVFEPRNIVCSGLSKLCFPLLEIFSVTQNNSPAKGRKTPPKSSFLPGTPCAETDFLAGIGSSPFSLEIGFAEPRFCTLPHKKRGKSSRIYPGKRLDLPFSFVNSDLLEGHLHKIEGYNTCFPTYQKEVPIAYFQCSTAPFPPSTRQNYYYNQTSDDTKLIE